MSDKATWFKFVPADWLAGTQGLRFELKGVYWDVCALIYDARAPIKNDAKLVARRDPTCKEPRARRLMDELIAIGKLRLTDAGLLTNGRSLDEIDAAERRIGSARDAAHRAGLHHAARARTALQRPRHASATRVAASDAGKKSKGIKATAEPSGSDQNQNHNRDSHREISTVTAREPSPADKAPARAQAVPDPVTQVATALRRTPPAGGAGDGRPPTPDEIARLVAELGVDPNTVETPPAPGRRQDVAVEGVTVEEPPSLAELAAAARAKFMNGGGS